MRAWIVRLSSMTLCALMVAFAMPGSASDDIGALLQEAERDMGRRK